MGFAAAAACAGTSVSYTHLDVYKRQAEAFEEFAKKEGLSFFR